MAQAYNTPELCNSYCARECPIGRNSIQEVTIDDFDRLALKVLGSLKDIDALRASSRRMSVLPSRISWIPWRRSASMQRPCSSGPSRTSG